MREYGPMKATQFTRKQINVIYAKAKSGELKVEKWVMNEFYELVDYYNYDFNGSVAEREGKILNILEKVFAGDIKEAQARIDRYTKNRWELNLTQKAKAKIDRSVFVA